ncbi:hypothetical protein EIN_174630 [Entamoeba invadens IP1]|uniref:GH15-like domain-containing protein n=1 Tax=Entamoeba invadens IP1 TaxID=370355 RepID=A0A0A1U1H5_ENTIV|nr:hypothetical protein EIN_174630 [Entamoeba invadens IP1]ELP84758.1 hypothetical protein EIN_174630 [Entamoeba invadens IP1]|eukprot:XP_004184104.1 hypothetical protein EIN_174630 [Entamoeba invadens IP1]
MLTLLFLSLGYAFRPNPSYGLTNFKDMTMGWCANIDSLNYKGSRPAGLCQLRWSTNNYEQNLLQGDGFVFHIDSTQYGDPFKFVGKNTIDYPGEYTHEIKYYNNNAFNSKVKVVKRYFMVPNRPILMEAYDITNSGSSTVTFNLLDYTNSSKINNNVAGGSISSTKSLYFDYKNDNAYKNTVVVMGMYDVQSLSLGDATGYTPISYFNSNSKLDGVTSKASQTMIAAMQKSLSVPVGSTVRVTVFRALATSVSGAESLSAEIIAKTYDAWKSQLTTFSDAKFAKYKLPTFANESEKKMWYSSVFTVLFSQNPTLGTLLASYHPLYYYKVWSRDAVFSSIIMTALGEYDGAEKFLKWLSTCELRSDGYFPTNYDWYTGSVIGFVEPQYDAVGVALTAYYYYYKMTGKNTLLLDNNVKNRIKTLENFLMIKDYNNLIRPDYSIWEESSDGWGGYGLPTQYYTFTQAQGHHGLLCAAMIEEKIYGDSNRANELRNRANELSTGFENSFWNEQAGHYVQSLWSDTKSQKVLIDSSTASIVFSGIATNQERIKKHFNKIRSDLTKLNYGIARYYNDPYFFESKFNPAGKEVGEASPPWGVTTMFMAWAELLIDSYDGNAGLVPKRIQWMIDHTGPDFIPCGEAVDGISGDPVMASMPDVYEHAGVYIMSVLQYQKLVPLFKYDKW